MVGGRRPLLPEIMGKTNPVEAKNTNFQSIFSRSASALTPSKRSSINTNRKSTTRFSMSLRWTLHVAPTPLKGGSKTRNGRFLCKIALRSKKVCYKVSLCEKCQKCLLPWLWWIKIIIFSMKKNTKYKHINTNELHTVKWVRQKPNPENCMNCSSKCAYNCTIQQRTVLIVSPLTSRRPS